MHPRELTVLYADADAAQRLLFERSVQGRYPITTVDSGAAALAHLAARPTAALLSAMHLTDGAGSALLAEVCNAHARTARIAVVDDRYDAAHQLLDSGIVTDVLQRPFDSGRLDAVLSSAVARYVEGAGPSEFAPPDHLSPAEHLAVLGGLLPALVHQLTQAISTSVYNARRMGNLGLPQIFEQALTSLPEDPATQQLRTTLRSLLTETRELQHDLDHAGRELQRRLQGIRACLALPRPSGPRPIDPTPALRFAADLGRQHALGRLCNVTLQEPKELAPVVCDAAALAQLLVELARGGVEAIVASGKPGRVHLRAEVTDESVHLLIEELPGSEPAPISPPGSVRGLQPPATPPQAELGLMRCRQLVTRWGGRFAVEGSAATGCTVRVTLPRHYDAPLAQA